MRRRGRAFIIGIGIMMAAAALSGCGKKAEEAAVTTEAPTVMPEETKTIVLETEPTTEAETEPEGPEERKEVDGKIQSYLTGEMVDVAKANRRPVAVMMSNDKASLPQYGINGQSTFAVPYLKNVDNINGVDGTGGNAFYRTKDKKAPHNAYTSGAKLNKTIGQLGYRTSYSDTYTGHFQFSKNTYVPAESDAKDAYKFYPSYTMNNPWFEYNEGDGKYYRFQYGGKHNGDGGQIAVRNVIFQYVEWGHYASTDYLNINVHKGGAGYVFTGGKCVPVFWKKDGDFGPTRYYDSEGKEVMLNKGKTWICIVGADRYSKAEIYGK